MRMTNQQELGSLEVGKRADFILLDGNILACSLDDLKTTQVFSTWLDGKLMWSTETSR